MRDLGATGQQQSNLISSQGQLRAKRVLNSTMAGVSLIKRFSRK